MSNLNKKKKPTTYHFFYLFNKWCYNENKMFILFITVPKKHLLVPVINYQKHENLTNVNQKIPFQRI